MLFLYPTIVFVTFLWMLYYYFTRTFKYWQIRNIPGPKPLPFFGNVKDFALRRANAAIANKQIYEEYPDEKIIGIYRMTTPTLIIRDLDVAKMVLIKDFDNFEDRGIELGKEGLGANLFHANADIWRPLRNIFSPLFTTSKLKNMTHLIAEGSDTFIEHVKKITETQTQTNVYTLFQKFTMSSILACAFGLDISADNKLLNEKMGKIDQMSFSRNIATELELLFPGILKKINSTYFPEELTKFFLDLVKDVIQTRNGLPSERKDFIDLILEIKNQVKSSRTHGTEDAQSPNDCVKLTNEVITAQAFIFYTAGYETNATTIAFMMYELAMNPHIQEKLLAEVDDILNRQNGKLTYDMISELSYMEKVFNETLRKYPVADIQRRAKANYRIPGTNVTIEKGMVLFVPTYAICHDETYYPDPKKFDPERFSPENESKRHSCAYIPFGAGPRYCIGMLFAKIQSRVCLMKFLSNFRVEISKKTPSTISFDPDRIIIAPKGGIYLNLIPRK